MDLLKLYQGVYDECLSLIDNKEKYSFLKNKKIAIIGASGLIGSYFATYLAAISNKFSLNIKIVICSNDEKGIFNLFALLKDKGDITKAVFDVSNEFPLDEDVDYILEAASLANPILFSTRPVETMNINYFGCYNALEFARKNHAKVIYVSSGEVYGEQIPFNELGFLEEQPGIVQSNRVRSCYTESKRACETLVTSYHSEYQVEALSARCCYIYGPTFTPSDSRVIFQFIRNVLNKEDIVLKSDGSQLRHYMYAYDACEGFVALFKNGVAGEAYNISTTDQPVSVLDSAYALKDISKEVLDYQIEVVRQAVSEVEKKGFSTFSHAIQNPQKLCDLGFAIKVPFKEGLKRTLDIIK